MFWDLRISYFFERKVIFGETGNQFLGTERVSKLMRQYAIPCIISLLVGALYNIVDQIFIANASYLGSYGNAANTVVFPLTVVALAIAVMLGDGCCAFVSMALGRNEVDKAKRSVGNAVVLSVASSLVLTAIYLMFANSIIAMFGGTVNEETFHHSQEYFFYITLGIPFYMFGQAMNPIIRADGNPKFAMISTLAGAVINIILDPLMIFGIGPFPEMGIRGAALATVIGQIFGMALGLWGVFRQQKVLNVNMREFKWRGQTIKDIYRVGLPGIVMQSVVSVMTAGMNGILIAFSQTAVNVLGVYFKLQTFVFMPVFGLNQGALPVMGYNYGARNRKRLFGAYKITLTAAVVIMALGLVLFQLLPEQMLMLFVDKSDAAAAQEMIEVGVPALKTISLSFLGAAFGIINSTLFQATARGMNSLIVSVCRQLVVILPAAWILGQQFGLNAVWYSFPIAEIAAFFISYILLWREYRTELRFLGVEREAKA